MRRSLYESIHEDFRSSFRAFLRREVLPHYADWERARRIPPEVYVEAGRHGFLGMSIAEEHGGAGAEDFRLNSVLIEECMAAGAASLCMGLSLQNELSIPYLVHHGTPEQQRRWLPGVATGEALFALALTEPGAGSDLAAISTSARRVDGGWVIDGAKTFISGGFNASRIIVAAKTDPPAGRRGMSLLVVDAEAEGFERGRPLEKIGLHAQDTAELFFSDVFVPDCDVLGDVGGGFAAMMHNLPQERLSIALQAVAGARAALDETLEYAQRRSVFGQPISAHQSNRFALAEMATQLDVAQVFVDRCVEEANRGSLSAADAAGAKWWCTELQGRVVDRCLQMHGGYGYMSEYPIARAFVDARVTRIYGGANEIMKEIVARSMDQPR